MCVPIMAVAPTHSVLSPEEVPLAARPSPFLSGDPPVGVPRSGTARRASSPPARTSAPDGHGSGRRGLGILSDIECDGELF